MNAPQPPLAGAGVPTTTARPEADDTRELLVKVHEAVTSGRRSGRLQAIIAVILSLATLTSTWCGYQASRWSGVQGGLKAAADTAERQAAEHTLAGLQIRTQDGLIVLEYWRALRDNDERTATTILLHMRPELRRAVEASIRQGIREDPSVPGPLQQQEYRLDVESLASARRQDARELGRQADLAGRTSANYVLLTLMLASVLFIGGISTTFSRRPVRWSLGLLAVVVFAVAVLRLTQLSVLWPSLSPPTPAPISN